MHELSIAMSIVEVAEEEAERQGGLRVDAVHLRLGPLSGVLKESLLSCYGLACENTPLEGSRLVIEEVPVVVYCPNCDQHRHVPSVQWFYCPECKTPTPDVVQGKELEVVALEMQD